LYICHSKMQQNITDISKFPEEGLTKAFVIEDLNGFGFQSTHLSEDGVLAFARLGSDAPLDFEANVRAKTGSKTLNHKDFIGHEYLTIHFTEWSLIPDIFVAAIEAGCKSIFPNITNLQPIARFSGEKFTFEEAERRSIEQFKEFAGNLSGDNPWRRAFEICGSPKAMRRLYNWRTFEGKLFCIKLCAKLNKPIEDRSAEALDALPWWYYLTDVDEASRRHEVLQHGNWSKRKVPDKEVSSSKRQKNKTEEPAEDDRVECVVCHDAVADTLTLPCEHVVVCHLCSVKLAQTHFADNCVYCRQHITDVAQDDPGLQPVEEMLSPDLDLEYAIHVSQEENKSPPASLNC